MTPQDAQKLLGGYATGTLTDAEQQALFAAALEDQELFDALAREQSLRDLLRDPAAKAQLLTALDDRPARRWMWWPGAAAAALAGVAAVTVLVVRINTRPPHPVETTDALPLAVPAPAPVGPLGVMPLPGVQPRRVFVPPAMAKPSRTPQLPEPPAIDMPRRDERADLKVLSGLPPVLPPRPAPKPESTTQTVDVTAASPVMPMFQSQQNAQQAQLRDLAAQSGRPTAQTLFYGNQNRPAAMARTAATSGALAKQPEHAGVRYTILRKQPGGSFAEVDPAELKTGDTVELRIIANTSGFLSIGGAAPVAVSAMTAHTTAPLAPGQQEVRIVFSRQPQTVTPAVQTVSEVQDRSTYVANPLPGQAVNFVIKLQYK